MTSPTTRYAATFAAGLAVGALICWLLRGEGETRAPEPSAPDSSPASTASASATHVPRRRAQEAEEAQTATTKSATPSQGGATAVASSSDAAGGGATAASGSAPSIGADGGATRPSPLDDATAGAVAPTTTAVAPAREATGVVVDATTQQPVAGARVLFAIAAGSRAGSWWGDTTAQDGRFHNRVDDDTDLAGMRMELRVSTDGYEPVRVAAEGRDLRVELRPRTTPVVPGRVVGVARGADGKPVAGEIEVNGSDGEGANATQWTVADASGAFVLDGMPPGSWQLQIGRGPRVDVTVPEGGETRVELTSGAPGDGHVVTDIDVSKATFDDKRSQEANRQLVLLMSQIADSAALDAGARERLTRQVAQEIQQLQSDALAAAPRRDVAITGLPATARTWVRLELRPRHFRRAEAQGGSALFPSVPLGTYQAVLVEPGRPDRTMNVVVATGDGRLDVAFR